MKKAIPVLFFLAIICSCKKDPETIADDMPFIHYYGTSGDETGRQVKALSDGDIAVCGYGAGPNGGTDFFLLRTDHDGNQRWIKYYGGAGNETTWSFDKTVDGGFVIGGYTNSSGAGGTDFCIVKTDADGNELWTKTYGGVYNDDAIHIMTVGNGFLISGISNSGNDDNAWIVRLDNNGDSLWSHNYGGVGGDGAMSACVNANGTFTVIGYTQSTFTNSADGFLMLLNDSGQQTAFYNYGTPDYDEPHAVAPAIDGNGWVVSGHAGSVSPISTHNVFLRAIAHDGTELWNYNYGGVAHDGSEDMCVNGTTYGIVARSNSRPNFAEDVYLLLINADGSVNRESWLGTDADDAGYGIAADRGNIILSGYSRGGSFGGKDIYLERVKN
ncbi:MAG: hypothetical protein M3R17_15320 [Bacteroidota bacterium]|nr:hypothetical protein [Bacteroidota bacterium]